MLARIKKVPLRQNCTYGPSWERPETYKQANLATPRMKKSRPVDAFGSVWGGWSFGGGGRVGDPTASWDLLWELTFRAESAELTGVWMLTEDPWQL